MNSTPWRSRERGERIATIGSERLGGHDQGPEASKQA